VLSVEVTSQESQDFICFTVQSPGHTIAPHFAEVGFDDLQEDPRTATPCSERLSRENVQVSIRSLERGQQMVKI
jgi:hypothetical protein